MIIGGANGEARRDKRYRHVRVRERVWVRLSSFLRMSQNDPHLSDATGRYGRLDQAILRFHTTDAAVAQRLSFATGILAVP
jgi:hypothetical protein